MDEYLSLVNIIETLMGPNGCPWDREQTLESMRSCIVEETAELIDAINLKESHPIQEELGDLFFLVIFLCKLAEKEGYCQTKDVLQEVSAKLIRRHPHIFGEKKVHDMEDLLKQWEEIKAQEKGKSERKNRFDGIPKELSTLARAQKMIHRLKKDGLLKEGTSTKEFSDEESLGDSLWVLVQEAHSKGLDAEQSLRKTLSKLELSYR